MPAEPPRRIGDFALLAELGAGGMGTVYRARHVETGVEYALKTLRPGATPEHWLRFQREGEGQARVDDHPNIVGVHSLGRDGATPFLVMDFAPDGSLADRLERGLPAPAQAARWVRDLALAVEHAHGQGVLHRDLKPQNVVFHGETPQLTDFGLVKLLDAAALTESGAVLGTPAYMAPEQTGGRDAAVGPATDVYGLGALLYHCLTGRPPFDGDSALTLLAQVLHAAPTPPRALRAEVPEPLNAVCLRALAKDPADRPATPAALARAIHDACAEEPAPTWSRRGGVVAAVVLACALGAGAAWLGASQQVAPTPAAPTPSASRLTRAAAPPPPDALSSIDAARRTTPCPGLHAQDVARASALFTLDADAARRILLRVLDSPPCRAQAEALCVLGTLVLAERNPEVAEGLYVLSALGGSARACKRLSLFWGSNPDALFFDRRPDPQRAAVAAELDALYGRSASPDDELLRRLLTDGARPAALQPPPTPSSPEAIWWRDAPGPSTDAFDHCRQLDAAGGDPLRDALERTLESPPLNAAHRRATRELAKLSQRLGDAAAARRHYQRGALMGDLLCIEAVASDHAPPEARFVRAGLPEGRVDLPIALAAIRLGLLSTQQPGPRLELTELHRGLREWLMARGRPARDGELPGAAAAYGTLWDAFPHCRP